MCGFTALFAYRSSAPPIDNAELLRIRDAMANRGPNGADFWVSEDSKIGLAHRRLAILDLSDAGAQPMATPDGKLRLVFNGEIYNFRELRTRLAARGYRFQSNSDTEILLYAYREYGQDMVQQLRGMFAFALWDEDRQALFLARDHFGIKPLYYHDDGKTLRIASQVKALLAGGGFERSTEPAGYVGFYLWGCVPEPYTLYRNLVSLPAGHCLWVDASGPRVPRRYFDIVEELGHAIGLGRMLPPHEALSEHLRESVEHHLVSDVPVGLFLSAGLDSTTITALATEALIGTVPLQAITLGFCEYEGTHDDEVPVAHQVASYYGCKHHVGRIMRHDFIGSLSDILHAMDQPTIDGINIWFVARETKRAGLKVAISGLGGDELLGGYPSFRHVPAIVSNTRIMSGLPGLGRLYRRFSAPLLNRHTSPKYASLFEYGGSYGGAYLLRRGLFMPWELPSILDGTLVREGWETLQPILRLNEWTSRLQLPHGKIAALEMTMYMRNMLLRDSDWAGMAHSVEIRLPFVDIELFRAMAPYLVVQPVITKQDLTLVARRPLPPAIVNRPKTGFNVPIRDWVLENGLVTGNRGLRGWATHVLHASQYDSPATI